MQKDIHPKYGKIKIIIGKDEFFTNSTLGTSGDKIPELLMDVDYRLHRAWNKNSDTVVSKSSKKVNSFNSKFAGLNLSLKK